MDNINIKTTFHVVCIATTLILLGYCFFKFMQNDSTSMVDFRPYHETEKDIYPSLSLCFKHYDFQNTSENNQGIYQKEPLINLYGIKDPTPYIKFLEGTHWDENLLNVDYDKVTMNLVDYVDSVAIKVNSYISHPVYTWNPLRSKESFPFRTTFRSARSKCFSFDFSLDLIPEIESTPKSPKKVRELAIELKSLASLNVSLVYFAHYPNQLMRTTPLTVEYLKDEGVISGNLMSKQFWMDNLEVIRRRNTMKAPCYDGSKNWDEHVISQILDVTKCKPPHWTEMNYPVCQNETLIQKLNIETDSFANPEFFEQFIEPCDEVQSVSNNADEFKKTTNASKNSSTKLLFLYKNGKYKEIVHIRSFDVESLIGNMGGYVGLFLGFAIWQAPDAIELVFKSAKRIFK